MVIFCVLILIIYTPLSFPWKYYKMSTQDLSDIRKKSLRIGSNIVRYHHHVTFISNYLQRGAIPKGFRMKHHHNIPHLVTDDLMRKCSKKLMKRTLGWNKRKLRSSQIELTAIIFDDSLTNEFTTQLKTEVEKRTTKLSTIFKNKRYEKYRRDQVTLMERKIDFNLFTPQVKYERVVKKSAKQKLIDDITIPSHEPINLTNNPMDQNLSSLCSKGPSFVPSPSNMNWLQLLKDFDSFKHRMRTRAFFSTINKGDQTTNSTADSTIQPPYVPQQASKIAPRSKINELEVFLSKLETDLFSDTTKKFHRFNLTHGERGALKDWQEKMNRVDSEIVLRIQDKGNRFVLVNKETDKEKAYQQIERSNFLQIDDDPTKHHVEVVKKFVKKWKDKGELNSRWANFIINEDAQPGKNSTLYKTHKDGTPVRLLTTGCNTAIENLAIFVEKHCAPIAESIPTRIKDTQHLLQIIDTLNQTEIPNDAILVSFDIVNMFPSIDNTMGINAVRNCLQKRPNQFPSTDCLVEALELCLTHNNSMFDGKHLIQTNGTAMGAANSCSYADIAIECVDTAVIREMQKLFKEMKYFGRYRDDCLSLWCGKRDRLQVFLDYINTLANGITFTMEIGGSKICFLDLEITIRNNKLATTVYCKPTNSLMYLHGNSCHPKKSKDGISLGVATRLRRICSTETEFSDKSRHYQAYLASRDHDPKAIKRNFETIGRKTREDTRRKNTRHQSNSPVTIFSSEYNPCGPNVKKILNKHIGLIYDSPVLSKIFPRGSVMVANKTLKNLKQLMVRADPYANNYDSRETLENPGYVPCHKKRCDSCNNFVDNVNSFVCKATEKKFTIRKQLTCTTQNVIYMCYCLNCNKQGIGSTCNWKSRLANYKSHIRKGVKSCQISKHFIECCNDPDDPTKNLRFVLIDYVDNTRDLSDERIEEILLEKEKFWIGTLCAIHKGLNGFHDWRRTKRVQKHLISDW